MLKNSERIGSQSDIDTGAIVLWAQLVDGRVYAMQLLKTYGETRSLTPKQTQISKTPVKEVNLECHSRRVLRL